MGQLDVRNNILHSYSDLRVPTLKLDFVQELEISKTESHVPK